MANRFLAPGIGFLFLPKFPYTQPNPPWNLPPLRFTLFREPDRMMFRSCTFALLCSAAALQAAPAKLTALQIDPPSITLTHAGDKHRIIVSGQFDDGTMRDLTRSAQYLPANPVIVSANAGILLPGAVGATQIEVRAGGLSKTIPVKVDSVAERPVSYLNDVIPIFSKSGCNQGACHGAASGKKGFKISLRGYDPAADYRILARGTDGHRINPLEPDKSLLLQKATGSVLHEGGKLFDSNSAYGKTLRRWIVEGMPNDAGKAPTLVDLEVFPKFRTLPGVDLDQQLLVLARFSDGAVRDVTADARYSSSNELAFSIGESGNVHASARGEAAVTARYGPKIAISTIVALDHDPKFVWPNPPAANFVDQLVFEKLKRMQIAPSDLCSDSEFLRRVYYDLIGLPPAPQEIKKFLADSRPDKRARIIDELLEKPEHAEYWALKWTDLFKLRFEALGDKGTWGLYRHVRDSLAANQPFNKFVFDLLTAEGSTAESPAANYYKVFANPEEASEATVQIFFGVRLLCAKCHDHPFEKWVQKDYYGMSAFFSQMGSKPGARRGDTIVFRNEVAPRSRHPNTGEVLLPRFLDAGTVDAKTEQDIREDLARWLTSKENPFFAKATVNRLWSHLFGKGIIDPVDDIRTSNPPSNAPLLDALIKDFVGHDFDVRQLLRVMLNSRTYQLSARTNATNAGDTINFSHRLPRRLSAEQLLDTLSQATGIPQGYRSRYGEQTIALPTGGVRAGQLPDKQLTAETLDLFGRPKGESSCACERHEEASMTQALHLINGTSVIERIQSPSGNVARMVQKPNASAEEMIEELYLLTLCRPPSARETETMKKHFLAAEEVENREVDVAYVLALGRRAGKPEVEAFRKRYPSRGVEKLKAAQDALWALVNTREFLFNH